MECTGGIANVQLFHECTKITIVLRRVERGCGDINQRQTTPTINFSISRYLAVAEVAASIIKNFQAVVIVRHDDSPLCLQCIANIIKAKSHHRSFSLQTNVVVPSPGLSAGIVRVGHDGDLKFIRRIRTKCLAKIVGEIAPNGLPNTDLV